MKTGLGIRPEFFNHVLEHRPDLGFLEAHSENYFRPSIAREKLLKLREDYSVSLHGVGLSLGRADALDQSHLQQLKGLVDEVDPILVSEHLAWSAYSHRHLPDLLPLPLTEEAFQTICAHITQMQDCLQRQILLENPSNYLAFDQLQVSEPEFLNSVAAQTGCGLLLDVNNVHVSAHNLGRDAQAFISALDSKHIKQYHLAGYLEMEVSGESLLIDTHNQTVYPEVWNLYDLVLQNHGPRPTLFEWDSDFPQFEVLMAECAKADAAQLSVQVKHSSKDKLSSVDWPTADLHDDLATMQKRFLDSVITRQDQSDVPIAEHAKRIWVYQNNSYGAIGDYLAEVYPATKGVVGEQFFRQMCQSYIEMSPPREGDIYHYGDEFAKVIGKFSSLDQLPYLADLIKYEWAIHCAYFAETSVAVDPSAFNQEDLLQLPLTLAYGVWLYNSRFPIYEIHKQSLPDYPGEVKIDLNQSEDTLLVFKQASRVTMRTASLHEGRLIEEIAQSENLLQAIEGLGGSLEAEKLSAALAMVFELGILRLDN